MEEWLLYYHWEISSFWLGFVQFLRFSSFKMKKLVILFEEFSYLLDYFDSVSDLVTLVIFLSFKSEFRKFALNFLKFG